MMPGIRRSFLTVLCVAFFLVSIPAFAQYVERVDVSIANIDVVVTDADGNPVRGLTREDFEVFEDGKRQTITNFSAYTSTGSDPVTPAGESTQPSAAPLKARPRLMVVFIDIDEIDPLPRQQFFEGLRAFVVSSFREGDLVTLFTWNNRVQVLLPPTSSRPRLDEMMDVLARRGRWSESELMRRAAELRVQEAEADAAFANSLGRGLSVDAEAESDFQEWLVGEQRCAKIKRKATEVRNLITSIRRVDMQNMLIFAGDDLSTRPIPGCYTGVEIEALARAANAYGMTIHALHPPGQRGRIVIGPERGGFLPGTRDPSPAALEYNRTFDEAGGLLRLANMTGGHAAVGAAMSVERLEQAAAELDNYYSIGYRFSGGKEDEAREVRVTTKNRRYRVRARQSVVKLSEKARLRDDLTASLYLPDQDRPQSPSFEARIDGIRRDGRFTLVHVELSILARDLVLLDSAEEKRRGSFSVFVVAGREMGDASPVTERTQELDSAPATAESRVIYTFAARVRPDTRRLSIAVRDNVSGEVATKVVELSGAPG